MKKYLSIFLSIALLAALLTGCGAASKTASNMEMVDYAADKVETPMEAEAASGAMDNGGSAGDITLPESRKWIITMHISAETDDLDALTGALNEKIGQELKKVYDVLDDEHQSSAGSSRPSAW